MRFHYTTVEYLQKVTCPLLVIHHPDDDLISFCQGRRLFGTARGPADFLEIKGGHNEGFIQLAKYYEEGLKAFMVNNVF